MKKCPKGVLCISNIACTLGFIILILFTYIVWLQISNTNMNNNKEIKQEINIREIPQTPSNRIEFIPNFPYNNFPYNNVPNSVLSNPYIPPLKDERYLVPINIPTNIGAVETSYRQLGILTPLNGVKKDEILPLMGRPLFTNRQKYQYYTISNQHNNIKLPVSVKGRSGTSDHGVDEIYNGDTLYVEGVGQPYTCTIYENDTIRYIPYL